MRLFFREHRSFIVFQIIQVAIVLGIIWLAGYHNYGIIGYCLFLYFVICGCYLFYKYLTRRKLYHLLSFSFTELDESLQKLDYAPLSTAVSEQLRVQYNLFQSQMLNLQNKQDEHLTFIDKWIHQMKTPISVLELIASELDEPDSSNIREEIDRLKSGLATVMYMSKLRTIKQDFHIKRVHLPSLLEEINRDNKRLFIRNNVYPKLAKDEDITIETDEKWLFFIINQLISNAIKYTAGRSKEITFSIFQQNNQAIFEIRDYGVGIPETDIKRIFTAFYTGENGRYFRESTGVGLYIVKEVITYLDHDIEVESTVGEGSTFRIIF